MAFVGEGNVIVTAKERPKAANSFGLLISFISTYFIFWVHLFHFVRMESLMKKVRRAGM